MKARLAVVLSGAAIVALVWALALEHVRYERHDAIADAVRQNDNLAAALQEHSLRTIRAADAALLYIGREFSSDGRVATVDELSDIGLLDSAMVRNVIVTNPDGMVLDDRGRPGAVSLAQRDFFSLHRNDAAAGLVISRPFIGAVTGKPIISLSRRIAAPEGSFGGIVAVALDPSYFLNVYKTLDLGPRGIIQLVGLDGIVRARRVGEETSFGHDLSRSSIVAGAAKAPAGNFVSRGNTSDGAPRYQSYRVLAGYPLVVSVGTAVDDALASFAARRRFHHASAAAGTVLLVLLAGALLLWLRQQQRILESERRLKDMFGRVELVSLMLDAEARITYCNDYLLRLTGWRREEILGRNWFEVFIAPEDSGLKQVFASLLRDLPQAWHHENQILTRGGERRMIRWNNCVLRDADGSVIGTASIGEDITEGLLRQRALVEQLDELRRFQKVTVERELRMIELEADLRALRGKAAA